MVDAPEPGEQRSHEESPEDEDDHRRDPRTGSPGSSVDDEDSAEAVEPNEPA